MDKDDEQQTTDKLGCGSTSVDEDSQELAAPILTTRVPGSGCGLLSVRNKHTLLALPSENFKPAKTSSLPTHFQSHRGQLPRPYQHTVHVFSATAGRASLCTANNFDAPGCRAASDSRAPRGAPVVTGRAAVSRQVVSPQLELPPEEDEKRVEEEEEVELFQSMLEETRRGDRRWADLPDDADYATDSGNYNTADGAGCRGPDLASAAAQPYVAQIHDAVALGGSGKVDPDHPGPLPVSDADAVKASERSHVTPSRQQTRRECQQGNGVGPAALPASMSFQTQQSHLPTLQQRIPEVQEQRQSLQQHEWSFDGPQDGNSDPSHPLGQRRPGSPLTGVNSRPKRQRREPAALSSYVSSAWRIHRTRSTKKQEATVSVGSLELTNGSGHSLGHQCMMPAPAPALLPAAGRGARHHRAPGPGGMVGGNGGPIIRSEHRGGPAGLLLRDRGPIRAQSSGWAPPRRKTHGSNDSSRLGSVRSCSRPQRYRRMSDLLLLPEVTLPAPKHSSSSDDDESGGEEDEDIRKDPVDAAALAGATATHGAAAVAEVQELITGASAAESASPAARSMRDASAVARELAAMRTLRQRIHMAVVLKGSNQVKVSIPSARVLFPEILPKVCSRAGKAVELYLAVPRAPMHAQSQPLHMGTGADASSDADVGALRLERLAGVSLYGGGVAWALTGLRGMVSALGLSNGQKARLITVPGSRHQQDCDNEADGANGFRDLPGVIVSRMDDGTGTSRAKEKPLWANNYNGLLTVPATVTERLFPEVAASGREATLPIQAFASLPEKSELRAFPGVCLRGLFRRVVLAGLKAALMQLGVQEGEEVALWRHADGRMVLSRRKDAPPLWPPGPTVAAVVAEDERVDVRRGTASAAALQLGCGRNRLTGRDRLRARGKDDSDEDLLDGASQAVAAEERAPADTAPQRHARWRFTPEFGNLEAAISIADPGQAYAKCWRDEVAPAKGSDEEDNDSGSELGEEPQVRHQPHCQPGSQRLVGPLQRRPHGAITAAQTAALTFDTLIGGSRSSSVPKTAVTLVAPRPSRPAAAKLGQPGATAADFHKASMRLRQAEGAALKPLRGLGLVADNDHTQEADGRATYIPLERLVYLDGRHRFKCVSTDVHGNRGTWPGPGLDPSCRITALELDLSKGATFVDAYDRGHRNHQQGDCVDGYEEGKDEDMDIEDSIPGKRTQRRGYMSGAPRGTVNGVSKGEGLVGGTVPCYTSVPSLSEEVSLHGAAPLVVVNCIGPTAATAAVTEAHGGVAPLQAVRIVRLSRGRPTQGDDARAGNTQRPAAPQLPILPPLQKRRLVSPHVFPRESMAGAEISLGAAERQLQSMGAYNKSNPKSNPDPPPRTSATVHSIRVVTGSSRTSTRDTYGEEEHQLPAQAEVTCAANSPPAGSGMVMGFRAPSARGGSGTVPHPSQQPPPRWVDVQVPIVEMRRGLPSGGILAGRVVGENPPPLGPPQQVHIRSGMSMSSPSYAAAQYGGYGEGNLAATARIKAPLVHLRRPSAAVPWPAPEAAAAATTLGCLASETELVTIRPTRAGVIHASACALEEPAGALALCSLLFPANGGALWWG